MDEAPRRYHNEVVMIFCAEIGSNHKGIKSLAFEMIRQAKLAGADIAKFQLGHPKPAGLNDDYKKYINQADTPYHIQKIRYAPMEWAQDLKDWCTHFDIEFMASIFSMEGLEVARSVGMKRYKFASKVAFEKHSNLNYDDFFEELLKDGKEVFISSYREEAKNVRPLWCVTQYPVYPEDIHIPSVLGEDMLFYGYSSHAHGIEDALIAIARGACYIEKHVTLSKVEDSIKDNHFALSFDEFHQMVDIGRGIKGLL